MKLCLSVRIAESSNRKDVAAVAVDDLAPLAAAAGFEGLSMRASGVSVDTPAERLGDVKELLDRLGLDVSMVMGNVALAANSAEAPAVLRDIGPHLDLADTLGARLVRVMIQTTDDIAPAQRALDRAAERGIRLAQQTHWGTLAETVDEALDLVAAIDRPNFGITFEPANLMACGSAFGPEAVKRLSPHLANVYFQNVRLDADGAHVFRSRNRGPVALSYVALDDPAGIDARPIIEMLKAEGYDGWFTVHQPLRDGQSVEDAIGEAAGLFKPLV